MTSGEIKNTANDIADGLGQTATEATSSAKGAASKAGSMARDFASQTSDTANDMYGRAQNHVKDAVDRLPDSASDAMAAGQRVYSKSSETVARQISKQPLEALLLAGAIGYLVGWATNRS